MRPRWLTAFIDRPAATFPAARDFWLAATATTLSPVRGAAGQFATLVPAAGDAHLRVQRIEEGIGGCHLDFHVDDVDAATAEAVALGATIEHRDEAMTRLRSPGGLPWCLVPHRGEAVRTPPHALPGAGPAGTRTIVDQLCIDIPAGLHPQECAFWAGLCGWEHRRGGREELSWLVRPPAQPLRLLLQRLGPDDPRSQATAHLDLACDDVAAAVAAHERLGATSVHDFGAWTAMADPSGLPYCLTSRNPDTGVVA
jgi:hypothetical protein